MSRSKILLRRVLLVVALAAFAISLPIILRVISPDPDQSGLALVAANTTVVYKQAQVRAGLPARLKIPRIGVDAAIEQVGLTPQGAVGVPKGPATVAWYNLGPRPGEKGSAVIDGHFGWKNGIPAVFDNVHLLRKGDTISVQDEKGVTVTFVVRELKRYRQNENVPGVFASSDGKAHLNLVTCEGVWNASQKSYSNRVVVFADAQEK